MDRFRPRGVAALLLVAALLFPAVAPLTAAPTARATEEVPTALGLVDALAAWLTALWPGAPPAGVPTALAEALGGDLDPSGQPAAQPQGGGSDPSGWPTVQPQYGGDLDPDG